MKAKHLYPSQFNNKGEWEDVKDIFAIEVNGQRQDSIYDQFKDLKIIADNIGCFDASDYLQTLIKKIEDKQKQKPIELASCDKCSEKIIQPDMLDERCSYIAGCKQMSKQEWESNKLCPLTHKKRMGK